MTEFKAIESLLKTGEKDNVDLAVAMLEGMPEIYRELRKKYHALASLAHSSRTYIDLFRSSVFFMKRHFTAELAPTLELLAELPHLKGVDFSGWDMRGFLPRNLYKLGRLAGLCVSETLIGRLPESWGGFEHIGELIIDNNPIKTLPKTMRNTQIDILYAIDTKIPHPVDFFAEWENIGIMYYTNHKGEVAKLER